MELVEKARAYVRRTLEESAMEEADWRYRWEHTLRVAALGREIAAGEGFDADLLELGCLLHDLGYVLCRTKEDYADHGALSARLAEAFLLAEGLDADSTQSLCHGIRTHTQEECDWSRPCTSFEASIVDADNIDRFDALRMAGSITRLEIAAKRPEELLQLCERMITRYTGYLELPFATRTARELWHDRLGFQLDYYKRLKRQMERTLGKDGEQRLFCEK